MIPKCDNENNERIQVVTWISKTEIPVTAIFYIETYCNLMTDLKETGILYTYGLLAWKRL